MAERKPRAVLNGVTVSFGLITLRADLVPAQVSKATRAASKVTLSNVCPTCENPEQLRQRLYCEHGHGPFSSGDARKAVEVDGSLQFVSPEAATEATTPSVDAKQAILSVFPAGEVEAVTLPGGANYRLRTDAVSGRTYALLAALVDDAAVAFVCEIVIKGVAKLYRAVAHGGWITFVELIRPEMMQAMEDQPLMAVEDPLVDQGRALVSALLETFDPVDWSDGRQERLRQVRDSLAAVEPAGAAPDSAAGVAEDLFALLEASVRAA